MKTMRETFTEEQIEEIVALALTHGVATLKDRHEAAIRSCRGLCEFSKHMCMTDAFVESNPWVLVAIARSNKRIDAWKNGGSN